LYRTWLLPIGKTARFLHNLLAYDFYIDQIYHVSVVFAVERFSKFTAWLDRSILDGLVNLVGLSTILGGQGLKYSTNGSSQFYVLTILLGVSILTVFVSWKF
jgi:NAD(P)H-quinone oxidoreductase subunit 5